eukprot:3845622-Ditylum_brightwellii.AAC.1
MITIKAPISTLLLNSLRKEQGGAVRIARVVKMQQSTKQQKSTVPWAACNTKVAVIYQDSCHFRERIF